MLFEVKAKKLAIMTREELKKQIEDLKLVINLEEENYKTALQSQMPYDSLKQMRQNIKKLKGDLQVVLDQESVQKTGDLPDGEVS